MSRYIVRSFEHYFLLEILDVRSDSIYSSLDEAILVSKRRSVLAGIEEGYFVWEIETVHSWGLRSDVRLIQRLGRFKPTPAERLEFKLEKSDE